MIIDLRSDTITRPSKQMLEAMMNAKVGDDVFGDDPTVINLEQKIANIFGTEAALFCPSGTMSNQIAIRLHTTPGSEVICDELSHVYLYEGGGIALNSGASIKTIQGNRGRITAEQVREKINNPNDIHLPISSLVSVENTMNKGGGSIYEYTQLVDIEKVCRENNLKYHLDGARLFNALVETNEDPKIYGQLFDTISVCLSKGLGCPVGSVLLGSTVEMKRGKRIRKALGGGMRQAGFLAAAGIYALDNNINRLMEDHRKAKIIGKILETKAFVKSVYPIQTNIVIFELEENIESTTMVSRFANKNILCAPFGKHLVRMVTHLDFTDDMLTEFETIIVKI